MNKLVLSVFTSLLTFIPLFFLIILPAQAATAISNCVITDIGHPPNDFKLPSECPDTANVNCKGAECAFNVIVSPHTLCQHYSGIFPPGHEGVDLCADANTPIHALEAGVVVESYEDYGCGNIVKLYDPKQKRYSLHCHMIRPGIAKNTTVKRGTVIGNVGHTGHYTSATDHVHYQITAPTNNPTANGIDPEQVLANWPNY